MRRINEGLREEKYNGEKLWKGCCGKGVEELWEEYKKSLESDE